MLKIVSRFYYCLHILSIIPVAVEHVSMEERRGEDEEEVMEMNSNNRINQSSRHSPPINQPNQVLSYILVLETFR
jgi:hypothetical protein